MLGIRLVRLIEKHSEVLSRELAFEIRKSERTSDFRKIPSDELQLAATELYSNLGEWLLQKTDTDIARQFRTIGVQRAGAGIRLHQFIWALMLTRDQLWRFLRREAFADTVLQLHGELELQTALNQFFDRAIYYAIEGYEEAGQVKEKGDLVRMRDLAMSIGLMAQHKTSSILEED